MVGRAVTDLTVEGYADLDEPLELLNARTFYPGGEGNDGESDGDIPEKLRELVEKRYEGEDVEEIEDVTKRPATPFEEFNLDLFLAVLKLREILEDEE